MLSELENKPVRQGDIYLIYFPYNIKGSMQRGYRPAVVIQNNLLNDTSPTVVVIPLTSRDKGGKIHYKIKATVENGLVMDSVALCESITTTSRHFIKDYCGHLSDEDFCEILSTLQNVFEHELVLKE